MVDINNYNPRDEYNLGNIKKHGQVNTTDLNLILDNWKNTHNYNNITSQIDDTFLNDVLSNWNKFYTESEIKEYNIISFKFANIHLVKKDDNFEILILHNEV